MHPVAAVEEGGCGNNEDECGEDEDGAEEDTASEGLQGRGRAGSGRRVVAGGAMGEQGWVVRWVVARGLVHRQSKV